MERNWKMKMWTSGRSNNAHTQRTPPQYRVTLHRASILWRHFSLGESSWRDLQDLRTFALLHRSAFKIRLNVIKQFRIFAVLFSKRLLIFLPFVSKIHQFDVFRNFSNLYGKDQNFIDSKISWDFATNIFAIFRKWFSKVRKMLESVITRS